VIEVISPLDIESQTFQTAEEKKKAKKENREVNREESVDQS
jgi:hypothetical protein